MSNFIKAKKAVICSTKLKIIAKAALRAKTFTAGISVTDPMKNTVDSVKAQSNIEGPLLARTLEITSSILSSFFNRLKS